MNLDLDLIHDLADTRVCEEAAGVELLRLTPQHCCTSKAFM